jgi:hypothetical protein
MGFCFKKAIKFVILGFLAVALFGFVTMQLWNWLIPDLFHGPTINIYQALGLFVLSKILFSGFGRRGCGGPRHNLFWRKRFERKMAKLSPEEREKYMQKFSNCWGGNPFENHCQGENEKGSNV